MIFEAHSRLLLIQSSVFVTCVLLHFCAPMLQWLSILRNNCPGGGLKRQLDPNCSAFHGPLSIYGRQQGSFRTHIPVGLTSVYFYQKGTFLWVAIPTKLILDVLSISVTHGSNCLFCLFSLFCFTCFCLNNMYKIRRWIKEF